MRHDIKIQNNSVFCDNQLIYHSDYKVLAFLNVGDKVALVLDMPNNQNVICIDTNGNKMWTIEGKDYYQADCPANNIYLNNEKHMIYRWCGMEEEIDIHSGKIISSLLIK